MTIGNVIKKYRKNRGMTQEEMAARLGVTAPAVNKWEKGNTLPDVALLAPIARLLGITTDELLSFKDDLTDEEINQYLLKTQKDLESKDFQDVFLSVKEKIQEYPNCEKLIWQAAVILDAKRMTTELSDKDSYEPVIFGWYERCLRSEDERIRNQGADSSAASAFEMGKYNEVCFGLDVAVWEKDATWTAQLMREILESIGTLGDFTKSKLYQHMELKPVDPDFLAGVKQELLKSLGDETFVYMQGNEDWEKLKRDVYE